MSKNRCGNNRLSLPDECCKATTGCEFNGCLNEVKAEPVYVQKVYDAALFNLQGLRNVSDLGLSPKLSPNSRIIEVLDIRCKRFFNPDDVADEANLRIDTETSLSGASFVKKCGKPVRVVGADGRRSEKLIYVDTEDCDEKEKGTTVFGTQDIKITGKVSIEIDILFTDDCDVECEETLHGDAFVGTDLSPIVLTNFFELCVPSVFDSAFLPRFTEFCNVDCDPRLATNNIKRDLVVDPETGQVTANLLVALCVTCEKKIIVPVQLCVLSTGFPNLSAEISPICSSFPTLFPKQIDEKSRRRHGCDMSTQDVEDNVEKEE